MDGCASSFRRIVYSTRLRVPSPVNRSGYWLGMLALLIDSICGNSSRALIAGSPNRSFLRPQTMYTV